MRSLPLPSDTHTQVFAACLAATVDAGLNARLAAISGTLAATATNYHSHATAGSLNLIPRVAAVGSVTKAELVDLYSDHLSSTSGAARATYDRIRNAAPLKRCPLCGVGTVAHLDHHLPKSRYPDLAILPANLVPACHFCNDTKKSKFPAAAGQQTFHPYFDAHLLGAPWVRATLNAGPPPVLVFDTDPPASWSAVDQAKVARHFQVCGIAVTFTSNANDELPIIRDRLRVQASRGGPAAVQQFLTDEQAVYASRPNSWQHATYRALAADPWFVGGGYNSVP